MAEYQAPMAENLRKSVGNVTYYMMHGKTFARAKVAHVKNAKTPKQRRQRAIFGLLVQMSHVLLKTTRIGFPEKTNGRSSSNEFVRANQNFVTVDENDEATIDVEKLQVSGGQLPRYFKVTVTCDAASKTIMFKQELPSESSLNGNPKDILYASILETEANVSGIVPLRTRGESGSTPITLPEWWKVENCKVYIFATSEDGHMASPSQYAEITTE